MLTSQGFTKAYSYLRFSTPSQAAGDSLRRQRTLAEEYAASHELVLDLTLTFEDLSVSAFRSKNARVGALREFLFAVERGLVPPGSTLLIESLDRLSRAQILLAHGLFLQIISASITIVTLIDERIYSQDAINTNPLELLISLVSLMRANDESLTKSRRLKETWKHRRLLAHTGPISSRCPFWLSLDRERRKFEIIPTPAESVRKIFSDYIDGITTHTIARTLNEGCYQRASHETTPFWTGSGVHRILRSPTVVGTLTLKTRAEDGRSSNRVTCNSVENYYPALISRDAFNAVQRRMESHRRQAELFKSNFDNLLAALSRCHVCGRRSYKKGNRHEGGRLYRYLSCKGRTSDEICIVPFVDYNPIEALFLNAPERIFQARCKFVGTPVELRHHTAEYLDVALSESQVCAGPISGTIADSFLAYHHLCKTGSRDISRLNGLLKQCFYSVVADRPHNRLMILWRDGAVGCVEDVWPASSGNRSWRSLTSGRLRVRSWGLDQCRVYGLLRGRRSTRFPRLTLEQVDEAKRRFADGEPGVRIAADLGVSHNTVMRRVSRRRKDFVDREPV